jgi:predicted PurR-regulated permease PerM
MDDKSITINFSPKTILWVIATLITVWLAFVLKEVFIIVFISFIFAAAVDPLVDFLEKRRIPRALAIAGIYLIVIASIVLIFRLIIPPTVSQASSLGQNKEIYIEKITGYFKNISPQVRENIKNSSLSFVGTISSATAGGLLSGAYGFFNGFIDLILVLVISFYLLLEKDGTEKWLSSYAPKKIQSKTLTIARKITTKMSLWFRGQLSLAFIIFLADLLALSLLRVDYALTLAIIAGFMEFLPLIGPTIAGTLAVLVALTTSPILALIVAVYYLLIQQIENHILVPQIMKKSVGLHPIAVIIALLAGGKLLGLLGMIIAVPVAAAFSVIYNELYKVNSGGEK